MRHSHSMLSALSLAAVVAGFIVTGTASASTLTIVSDTFTDTNGTSLSSHAPDVNLPGASYVVANGATVQGNTSQTVPDGAFGVSLASAGSYTKPTQFHVSATLNLNGETGASANDDPITPGTYGILGGTALGFYKTGTIAAGTNRGILGVDYNDIDDGSGNTQLLLVEPNSQNNGQGAYVLASTASIYSVTGDHVLAYDIDTTAGTISNITFDGVAAVFSVPISQTTVGGTDSLYDDTNTFAVGSYSRGSVSGGPGIVDNLLVTTEVPEPTSLSLLGLSAATLIRRRRVM